MLPVLRDARLLRLFTGRNTTSWILGYEKRESEEMKREVVKAMHIPPTPIPRRKRYAQRAASMPEILPPAPQDPALRIEKSATMPVAVIMPVLRPRTLSER